MTIWRGTLGELISAIYERCVVAYGDQTIAAVAAARIVHELLESNAEPDQAASAPL